QGEAVRIWTGGILPPGADAVVMLEYVRPLDDKLIEVYKAVAPNENVILKGEDCRRDTLCIKRGTRLRPQELGLLSGLGICKVKVTRRPRAAIISTGDELVPETESPPPGKIRDINSTTLEALLRTSGAVPTKMGIISDYLEAISRACADALSKGADIVLVSGGSSVGHRDFTVRVFEEITGAPPLVHGVAIRPGKPTILSRKDDRALFGLPGHVASCMVVYLLFVHYLVNVFQGLEPETGLRVKKAVCGEMFPSVSGREDYVRVRLEPSEKGGLPVAIPIYGKSGIISTLVQADGLLKIPRDSEGYHQGEEAEVLLLP
ncbi:MAG: molybdopterin molybdotransferase MoeA, partial [Thermodesulfobacteria bacterium]|nr:molybdopterin molybdotransferase MoeA [Thermodesulfobacteriota bacterium]